MRSNKESSDDLIILKTYDQALLANIDVAKLNDEGIECFL